MDARYSLVSCPFEKIVEQAATDATAPTVR